MAVRIIKQELVVAKLLAADVPLRRHVAVVLAGAAGTMPDKAVSAELKVPRQIAVKPIQVLLLKSCDDAWHSGI